MVCPAYTNSKLSWAEKDGEGPGRMAVFREEEEEKKMFNVSSTQGSIKNPCSPQRICSCCRTVLPRPWGLLKIGLWGMLNRRVI